MNSIVPDALVPYVCVTCNNISAPWWRHQMETFSALLAICAGNSPVPGEFPTQRPVTRSFDGYFDLRPNKRLSKQSLGWWFETLSLPLWRHRNDCQWSNAGFVSLVWWSGIFYWFLPLFMFYSLSKYFVLSYSTDTVSILSYHIGLLIPLSVSSQGDHQK